MTKTEKEVLYKALKSAAFFAAYVFLFVLAWQIAFSKIKNDYLFPSLKEVCKEIGAAFQDKFFLRSYLASFLRTLRVFFLSFAFAAFLAVIAYLYPVFSKIFAPVVGFLRAIPTMAVLLMILIWTNPSDAPVVVGFLALFPMLYTGIFAALSTVDKKLSSVCKVYRVPLKKQIFQMYLPQALPYVLRECSGGLSFGLKLIVSAEVMASTYVSLGGMLQESKMYLQTPRLFALTLIVVVTGLLLEGAGLLLARLAERRTK